MILSSYEILPHHNRSRNSGCTNAPELDTYGLVVRDISNEQICCRRDTVFGYRGVFVAAFVPPVDDQFTKIAQTHGGQILSSFAPVYDYLRHHRHCSLDALQRVLRKPRDSLLYPRLVTRCNELCNARPVAPGLGCDGPSALASQALSHGGPSP